MTDDRKNEEPQDGDSKPRHEHGLQHPPERQRFCLDGPSALMDAKYAAAKAAEAARRPRSPLPCDEIPLPSPKRD